MEKCFRAIIDGDSIQQVLGEISCDPKTIIQYPNWLVVSLVLFGLIVLWSLVGYPKWRVWASLKKGESELQHSLNQQKIQITQAQSRLDAASLNKDAAIVEAEAVSEQIKRIGNQLTQHDLFLKWQWIEMMEKRPENSVIYVPTEASMPILEANRLNKRKEPQD